MANNLDRLFRENLDQLEVTPSENAWTEVKSQLVRKKSGWISPMKIAASISVIVCATVAAIYLLPPKEEGIVYISHPVPLQDPTLEISIPIARSSEAKDMETIATGTPSSVAKVQAKEEHRVERPAPEFREMNSLRMALVGADFSAKNLDLITEDQEVTAPAIKITYIASEVPASADTSKTGKLNKVFAIAKEVASGELLADLREAKDNLFRKN